MTDGYNNQKRDPLEKLGPGPYSDNPPRDPDATWEEAINHPRPIPDHVPDTTKVEPMDNYDVRFKAGKPFYWTIKATTSTPDGDYKLVEVSDYEALTAMNKRLVKALEKQLEYAKQHHYSSWSEEHDRHDAHKTLAAAKEIET